MLLQGTQTSIPARDSLKATMNLNLLKIQSKMPFSWGHQGIKIWMVQKGDQVMFEGWDKIEMSELSEIAFGECFVLG